MAAYGEGNYAEGGYADAVPSNPSGSLTAVLPKVTASFTGTYAGAVGGTLSAALPHVTATFAGTYTQPICTGTLTAVLPKITASFSASYIPLSIPGTFAATLPAVSAPFVGKYLGPYPTDTSNSRGGLDILCAATVTLTRPSVAPSNLAPRHDKAVPLPPPTLVNGRVT